MTFDEARTEVRNGRKMRRKVWDTWVRQFGPVLKFIGIDHLYKKTDYTPTPHDVRATDWEIAA